MYYQKFAPAATNTGQATLLFSKTQKTDIFSLKDRGSLKQKKCPSEQWKVIRY
jgi:hypothetical protein